jgi:probable rRNA maturation factor
MTTHPERRNAPGGILLDLRIEDKAWSRKRLGLGALTEDALLPAWTTIRGRSRAVPIVSVLFTGDAAIRRLNRRFRGKDKATNVLSFQSWDDIADLPSGPVAIGDIVLALETAMREADERGVSLREHATYLLIHGFLHLCGYDHETDSDAAAMEGLEARILKKLGCRNPYAAT